MSFRDLMYMIKMAFKSSSISNLIPGTLCSPTAGNAIASPEVSCGLVKLAKE